MKKTFLALTLVIFFCSFCKKDNNTQTTETLLIDGDWVHTAYKTDDNNDGVFEDAALPCQIGDVWRFSADHKFQWRDEVEYCDTDVDSVAVYNGTWELRNSDTEIYVEIDPIFLYFTFKIQNISANALELRQYNDPASSLPAEERFAFVK